MKRYLLYGLSLILLLGANGLGDESAEEPIEEIVITATKTPRELKDLSGNVTVITAEEIAESNAFTADEILAHQCGIDVMAGKSLGSKPVLNIRGMMGQHGTQRVLILIDGRPMTEEYMGDVDLRTIPMDNIEKIEVVRGPVSALYGTNAMGGVINFITKRHQADKPLFNVKTFVGSFNTYGTIIQHGAKFGELDYFITANDETTDGYLTNSDGTQKDWQTQNVTGRLNWSLGENELLSVSLGWNDGESNDQMFIQEITRDYQDIVYRTNWSLQRWGDFLVRVYRNGLDQVLRNKPIPFIAPLPTTDTYDQYTIGSQIQQSIQLRPEHLLTFGVDTKQENASVLDEDTGKIDETVNSEAIYIQDEIVINEQILVTVGLRYDRHEEFGGEVSPKIGAVYHLNDQTTLRSAVGKAYRAPSVSDLYLPTTAYWGKTYQGNPNLDPETVWSFEVGVDHEFTDRLSGSLTVYQSSLKDGWDYMKDPDNIHRPHNVEMSITGLETEAKYRIAEGLESWANYAYTRGTYEEYEIIPSIENNYLEDVPMSQGSLGMRFQPDKGSTVLNLKLRGSSSRYTDAPNTHSKKLDKYLVMDIGINTKVNEKSSIFISVNNIFDREYNESEYYVQPGRWFTTGVSMKF